MPRVSIGVPVYNGERFIRQSVESLLAQTYGDFELVITDNASKDGTEEVCRELAKKDKRVQYVRNDKNLGGPGNFRRVFALCSGEFHKWSTADDFWEPTIIEKCVAVLDREPDVVLVTEHGEQGLGREILLIVIVRRELPCADNSHDEQFVRAEGIVGPLESG